MVIRSNCSIDSPNMTLVSNYCLDICFLTELFVRLIGHTLLHKTTTIDYLNKTHTIIGLCYVRTEHTSRINSLRPSDSYFPNDSFKSLFLNANVWILIKISLKFVSRDPINNIQALVQMMASRQRCDGPLSEAMLISFTDAYMRYSAPMR